MTKKIILILFMLSLPCLVFADVTRKFGGSQAHEEFWITGDHSGTVDTVPTTIIIANGDGSPEWTEGGTWGNSTYYHYYYSSTGYRYCDPVNIADPYGDGTNYIDITPTISTAGYYKVFVQYAGSTSYAPSIPVTVYYNGGTLNETVYINQSSSTYAGYWVYIGIYYFDASSNNYVRVSDNGVDGSKYITLSAVKFMLNGQTKLERATNEGTERMYQSTTTGFTAGGSSTITHEGSRRCTQWICPDVSSRIYKALSSGQTQANSFGMEVTHKQDVYQTYTGLFGFFKNGDAAGQNFVGFKTDASGTGTTKRRIIPRISASDGTDYDGTAISHEGNRDVRIVAAFTGNGGANSTGQVAISVYDVETGTQIGSTQTVDNGASKTLSVDEYGATGNTSVRTRVSDVSAWIGGASKQYEGTATWTSPPIPSKFGLIAADGLHQYAWDLAAFQVRQIHAAYHNNTYERVYLTYLDDFFNCWVRYYDLSSNSYSIPYYFATVSAGDFHRGASIVVDSSHYVHVFYDAHASDLKHKKATSIEDISTLRAATVDTITGDITYPQPHPVGANVWVFANDDVGGAANSRRISYWSSSDSYASRTDIAKAQLAEAAGQFYRLYFTTAQASNGDVWIAGTTVDGVAYAWWRHVYCFKIDSYGNLYTAGGTQLTSPVYTEIETGTVSGVSSTYIDVSGKSWADDFYNNKYIYIVDGTAAGTWYQVTDTSSSNRLTVNGDPSGDGVAVSDSVRMQEKDVFVFENLGSTSYDISESVYISVYGSGANGAGVFVGWAYTGTDSIDGSYVGVWDNDNSEWDAIIISSLSETAGPQFIPTSTSNVLAIQPEVEGAAGTRKYYTYESSDGGYTWGSKTTLVDFFYQDANRAGLYTIVHPTHSAPTELQALLAEGNFPDATTEPVTGTVMAYGSSYPDYVASHAVTEVDWNVTAGSASVRMGCGTSSNGVNDTNITWRTLSDGQTDFSSWAEFANCEYMRIEITPPTGGDDFEWFLATLGQSYSIPQKQHHYKLLRQNR